MFVVCLHTITTITHKTPFNLSALKHLQHEICIHVMCVLCLCKNSAKAKCVNTNCVLCCDWFCCNFFFCCVRHIWQRTLMCFDILYKNTTFSTECWLLNAFKNIHSSEALSNQIDDHVYVHRYFNIRIENRKSVQFSRAYIHTYICRIRSKSDVICHILNKQLQYTRSENENVVDDDDDDAHQGVSRTRSGCSPECGVTKCLYFVWLLLFRSSFPLASLWRHWSRTDGVEWVSQCKYCKWWIYRSIWFVDSWYTLFFLLALFYSARHFTQPGFLHCIHNS